MKNKRAQIARMWHGIVSIEKADDYFEYLQHTGLKDYRNVDGNLGVRVLRRTENDRVHFLLITFWDSYESIRTFAGEDYERARYYPDDEKYLLELKPFVTHYEVLGI